jgi:hypothetical protein
MNTKQIVLAILDILFPEHGDTVTLQYLPDRMELTFYYEDRLIQKDIETFCKNHNYAFQVLTIGNSTKLTLPLIK